ncbi:MAG: PhoH family protein [Actinobacteria bacterium]|nr:PhoH family protein [Actinomycetota bacterium]
MADRLTEPQTRPQTRPQTDTTPARGAPDPTPSEPDLAATDAADLAASVVPEGLGTVAVDGDAEAQQRTCFVIDTCVLLADPNALYRFAEHDVIVPLVVVEELDRQKSRMDEVGANARQAVRLLEDLRVGNGGSLSQPVPLPGEGRLWVESNHLDVELPPYLEPTRPDHRILATSIGTGGVLVTKDAALRLKAAQLGARTQDYRGDTVRVGERYDGVVDLDLEPAAVDTLHREGQVTLDADPTEAGLVVNQCAVIPTGGLARVVSTDPVRLSKVHGHRSAFGVHPRDARQTHALDLLLDEDVPCVSMMGMAGTGKTFLALAAGLEQVIEAQRYRRLSVYRPLVAVGKQEVGYLPGDLDEKLAPWMAAVYDNLYALFRRDSDGGWNDARGAQRAVEGLLDRNQLEMAAITYLRGRSITDEYVIIDEAQNLELSTLKVILTRMGEGSKVVFCGDLSQVDNPYISPYGGMAALIERMKGHPLFGHVTLAKGQRSPLAELAATSF